MQSSSKKQLRLNKQISIIGCGWLGLPLAKQLISNGLRVKGSTTSIEKLKRLQSVDIEPFLVQFTNERINGDIEGCLQNSEVLVLNVPPRLRKNTTTNFIKQIELLIPYIESSSIKKLVFISSTSVYADDESMPNITETTKPNPETESGKQLLIIERLLQANNNFKTTILRFAGLFGEDRHPATFLSGKTNIKNPDAPVNLVHQQDCIDIIISIIENECWNTVFNVATSPHPTKKNYYISVCKSKKLPLPEFDQHSISKGKIINSSKLVQILNYTFKTNL